MDITQFDRRVAAELRGHLARHQMMQTELAEAIGLSQSQTSKILRGTRCITVGQLDVAARHVGTTAADICVAASLSTSFANGGYLPVPEGADLGAVPRSEVILLRREA